MSEKDHPHIDPKIPSDREISVCSICGNQADNGPMQGLCPRCLLANIDRETESSGFKNEAPSIEQLSTAFPQFEILELIGRGGMGFVYRVRQRSLDRIVALKVLVTHSETPTGFEERFSREARALAELNHPNIVTIHDYGSVGDLHFLMMEYVDGVNLRQAMRAGRFTPQEALAMIPPICSALQYAHQRGIVHRDIKPENLLLDREGRIKLADFGIARMMEPSHQTTPLGAEPNSLDVAIDLTQSQLLGTPAYMSPEQWSTPTLVDQRADIYSLGVVLYEMLTGELPTQPLKFPSERVRVDVRIDEIVVRALQHSPELRFRTANEMTDAIQRLQGFDDAKPAPTQPDQIQPAPKRTTLVWPSNPFEWKGALWKLKLPFAIFVVCYLVAIWGSNYVIDRWNHPERPYRFLPNTEPAKVSKFSVINVKVDDNILFLDLCLTIENWTVLGHFGFQGSNWDDSKRAETHENAIGKPWVPTFPQPCEGNMVQWILKPGEFTSSLALPFPTQEMARLAAEDVRSRTKNGPSKFSALEPANRITLFKIHDVEFGDYQSWVIFSLTKESAKRIYVSEFGSFDQSIANYTWLMECPRPWKAHAKIGDEEIQFETGKIMRSPRQPPASRVEASHAELQLTLKRLNKTHSQIRVELIGHVIEWEVEVPFRELNESIQKESPKSIATFTGLPFQLFQIREKRCVIQIGDVGEMQFAYPVEQADGPDR